MKKLKPSNPIIILTRAKDKMTLQNENMALWYHHIIATVTMMTIIIK